ncbi:hypothetical protein TBR22_A42330 [Luteitalea sp. TBR-22]|uniref:hypothetical protein n=1 Tax=Luteitalea sp. TBR-22 TaxID=2802971 RepID=UPI001AF5B2F7|nr:hypothetical protein [Luteitalea sp. TBR-22]BCS35007.1 hypothetical protein TBR22_A42330 [Luteitalea sp. TBR-22]
MYRLIEGTTRVFGAAILVLGVAAGAAAQPSQTTQKVVTGPAKVTKQMLKGEVVAIKGNQMVASMIPGGAYRLFSIKPGKTATVDGVVMPLVSVKPGTVLTADVYTAEVPMVQRTVTTLKGTVWHASPTTVILTLENGHNKQYEVPNGLKFNVDGQMKQAMELRPGMIVTATKIVEVPETVFTQDSVVTGTTKK